MAKQGTRKQLELLYDHLYEIDTKGSSSLCAYCNDIRHFLDHIPALYVVDLVTPKELTRRDIEFVKVPCCKMCNSVLGHKKMATYEERLVFIYNHTLKKLETTAIWSSEELSHLGGELRRMVTARQLHIRREYLLRLRGMEARLAAL